MRRRASISTTPEVPAPAGGWRPLAPIPVPQEPCTCATVQIRTAWSLSSLQSSSSLTDGPVRDPRQSVLRRDKSLLTPTPDAVHVKSPRFRMSSWAAAHLASWAEPPCRHHQTKAPDYKKSASSRPGPMVSFMLHPFPIIPSSSLLPSTDRPAFYFLFLLGRLGHLFVSLLDLGRPVATLPCTYASRLKRNPPALRKITNSQAVPFSIFHTCCC